MALDHNERLKLWKEYKGNKNPAAREKLILEYSHLIKYVAGRLSIYFASNVEYDDLVGFGVFGLIDAIEKFDLNKGVKFETYANLRIRGAIIDSVRELDWIPRSLRQKSKDFEKAYKELEAVNSEAASDEEIAQKLGISLKELYKRQNELNLSVVSSLDEYLEQSYNLGMEAPPNKDDNPEEYIADEEMKKVTADAIDKLPEKEKLVLNLYYFEEMTLKEISAIMKVSESRISQLHTKALMRMKERLARYYQ